MQVVRVGPLPDGALEAAAEFHGQVVALIPPRNGEGDRPQDGGGGSPPGAVVTANPHHHTSAGPPPYAGEDLVLIFRPAPYDHRSWRLAAVQDLARTLSPTRVNGIVGDDESAIAEALAYLEAAPGVTGQLVSVEPG